MKKTLTWILACLFTVCAMPEWSLPQTLVRPDNPYIQYFGRWDKSDSTCYRYSWPGVYLVCSFTGTSIGVRLIDGTNYFNVTIDDTLRPVFHCTKKQQMDYILASGLGPGTHTLRLSRRNITFEPPYSFCGIILDNGASLVPPPPAPLRKIEFIGDSFTAGESDEATEPQVAWEARYPVTNIDKGFAADIARHFHAQYTTTCRSGSGMVCDWQGNTGESIPKRFERTLMEANDPKWDFRQWIPDVVVMCLGLNDYSGLKEKDGSVFPEKSELFRRTYHEFIATVRTVYPGAKIVAVAAFPAWIRFNVKQVVQEERDLENAGIYYSTFDEFPGGYVANGHPTVATHQKMADQIIKDIESLGILSGKN